MEKLYEIHERGEYDLLVLDTPPSRNALDFLDAPRRLVQFVDGRSLRLFLRPAGIGARIAEPRGVASSSRCSRRLTGLDLIEDLSEFFAATSGMVGGFRERAERVNQLLAAEGTTFLIVCGPAGEPIEEAVYLREKLARGRPALRRGRRQPGPRRSGAGARGAEDSAPPTARGGRAIADLAERVLASCRRRLAPWRSATTRTSRTCASASASPRRSWCPSSPTRSTTSPGCSRLGPLPVRSRSRG